MYQSALWNYQRQDLTCQNCENQVYSWENYPKTAKYLNFLNISAHWMNKLLLTLDIFISVNSWSTRVPFTTIVGRTKPVKIAKIRGICGKNYRKKPKIMDLLDIPAHSMKKFLFSLDMFISIHPWSTAALFKTYYRHD